MGGHERRKHPRKDTHKPVVFVFGKKKYSGFLLNISQSGALIQLDHKMKKIPEEAGAPLEIRLVEEKESIKGTLIRAFLDKDQKFFCAATFSDLLPEI